MSEQSESFQKPASQGGKEGTSGSDTAYPDEAAIVQILRDNGNLLHRRALELTGNPEAAMDAVQETFIALLRNWNRVDHENQKSLQHWLRRVLQNRCLDILVEHQRTIQRQAEEIAAKLSVSEAAVAARLRRAITRLHEVLYRIAPGEMSSLNRSPGHFQPTTRLTGIEFGEDEPNLENDHKQKGGFESEITLVSALEKSKEAYRVDLPELLVTSPGRWVAYADGNQVKIGNSQRELYRHCLGDVKLTHDRFIVRQVIPEESPDIEVIER